MSANLTAFAYLIAAVLFVLALRGLSSPVTSRQGNLFGMVGMAIAMVTTLASHPPADLGAWGLVVLGLAIGGSTGAVIARRVPMTAMPELVAAFHSLVGMAAVLVAVEAVAVGAAARKPCGAGLALRRVPAPSLQRSQERPRPCLLSYPSRISPRRTSSARWR